MSKLLVTGRKKLDGEVEVQGAKNSALPIIAASILTKGENVIPIVLCFPMLTHLSTFFGISAVPSHAVIKHFS